MAMTEHEKELIKKARREYKREWRRKNPNKDREWRENNPDKVKAASERYWLKKILSQQALEEERKNGE